MTKPSSVKYTPFRSFLKRVAIGNPDECWRWLGHISKVDGYGRIMRTGNHLELAHRESWRFKHGEIPDGLLVRHLCHTRWCVNWRHLALGTDRENRWDDVLDGRNYNQQKTHCKNGHLLSGDNLYINPSSQSRQCKTCMLDSRARYRAKKRAQREGAPKVIVKVV